MNSINSVFKMWLLVAMLAGLAGLLSGCGISDKALSESTALDYGPQIALPYGTYLVGTIPTGETIPARTVCASDNSRPQMTVSGYINQLIRFNEVVADTLTVKLTNTAITKVWARTANILKVFPGANTALTSPTCSVTWTGTIATNLNGTLQETGAWQIAYSPTGCQMEAHDWSANSIGGAYLPDYASVLVSTNGKTNQGAWTVTNTDNVYTLTMPAAVAANQTGYTCADGTKVVKMIWTKQ